MKEVYADERSSLAAIELATTLNVALP